MHRRSIVLLGVFLLGLGVGGCRADDEQCRDLARHIVEVAESEGQAGTAGTAVALEGDCNSIRPTKRLVECMMNADSLAKLDGC